MLFPKTGTCVIIQALIKLRKGSREYDGKRIVDISGNYRFICRHCGSSYGGVCSVRRSSGSRAEECGGRGIKPYSDKGKEKEEYIYTASREDSPSAERQSGYGMWKVAFELAG